MSHEQIRASLLNATRQPLKDSPKLSWTADPDANALIDDLDDHPHAFVLACVMDRQIRAERAWIIPHRFRKVLGDFEMRTLQKLTRPRIEAIMKNEELHRFPAIMSGGFHAAVKRIAQV